MSYTTNRNMAKVQAREKTAPQLSAADKRAIQVDYERQMRFERHEKAHGDTARMRARLGLAPGFEPASARRGH